MALEFFTQDQVQETNFHKKPYNAGRALTGSAERLTLDKSAAKKVEKRTTSAWQTAAWQYLDSIGEIHFAFNLIGQVMSRVRLYPAIVHDSDQPPVNIEDYLEDLKEKSGAAAPGLTRVAEQAGKLMDTLAAQAHGGLSGMLRAFAINLSVPGETYLLEHNDEWIVASTDEITQKGDTTYYRRTKQASASSRKGPTAEEKIANNAFIARIWRSHPRYSSEPDSSMIGVLDDCEQLVLLTQALRSMTRSRMTAGIMFVPEGLTSFSSDVEQDNVETAIARASMEAVEDESSQYTVAPLILKGPPELGDKIKWIPFGRQLDEPFLNLLDRSLDRVLQGLDIPKDVVTGLASVKYSNAVVIDENLYRAHVEPLVLLIIDALTNIYLRPLLRKALDIRDGEESEILNRIVVWADTSAVVTRADKSTAANEGYDRKILSAVAWRNARGFSDVDAPEPEELLQRTVLERGPISPEVADALLARIDPDFFSKAQSEGAAELPSDIASMLNPGGAIEIPNDASELEGSMQGADVNPQGNLASQAGNAPRVPPPV